MIHACLGKVKKKINFAVNFTYIRKIRIEKLRGKFFIIP